METSHTIKIVFYGDSICAGQRWPTHLCWVTKISQKLWNRNNNIVVSNFSINGRTTRQALETVQREIQQDAPNILVVQFGMNDCNFWQTNNGLPRVSKKSFKSNLIEIIQRARSFGVSEVVLITNHPTLKHEKKEYAAKSYQQSNKEYNEIIREVFIQQETRLVDMEMEFTDRGVDLTSALLEDGIHLGQLGHQTYEEKVYKELERILCKLKK